MATSLQLVRLVGCGLYWLLLTAMVGQASAQYLVDFGQHGSLLNQPLITPSTDCHSVQTDDKALTATAVRGEVPERSLVRTEPSRCHHITLIILAILLVLVAAIALPLWLIPSGTG